MWVKVGDEGGTAKPHSVNKIEGKNLSFAVHDMYIVNCRTNTT